MFRICVLGAAMLLSACAAKPADITPAFFNPSSYHDLSCSDLANERVRLEQLLAAASDEQASARTADAVTLLVIGIPIASTFGADFTEEIAGLKGQKSALEYWAKTTGCWIS